MNRIPVKVVRMYDDAPMPKYMTIQAAGFDLAAYIIESERVTHVIPPFTRGIVNTGLRFGIPEGYEIQVRPRSGLAFKNGITVLNSPGTIDADYTGELRVIIMNESRDPFRYEHGDRIAQAVLAEVPQAAFIEADDLGETERGEKGFGHTGRA